MAGIDTVLDDGGWRPKPAPDTAAVVREFVRHLNGDRVGLDLLDRLLSDLDVTLCPLIPPPPAQNEAAKKPRKAAK